MNNKYSLNAESYGISKVEWNIIKKNVINKQIKNDVAIVTFSLDETFKDGKFVKDKGLAKKRVWFLYDKLLQEKYNHLYKREKLVNPKVGDYVYCDYEGFGRGKIVTIKPNHNQMFIEFDKRKFQSLCNSVDMVTIHDNIKRKITKI